jgi:RNA polymerase sigma-70 factor (ECF subfamily)
MAITPSPSRHVHPFGIAESISDDELVIRATKGDRWAQEAIYRRYVGFIARTTTRLLGRRDDAEDVVQDTFAIGLAQLHTLRDGAAVRAWLAQIAVSQVRRRFRRTKLLRVLGLDRGADDATLEQFASDDATPEVRSEIAALDRILRTLPAEERFAWMLRRVEGWGLDEVALACKCSLATVKRRVSSVDERVRAVVDVEAGNS